MISIKCLIVRPLSADLVHYVFRKSLSLCTTVKCLSLDALLVFKAMHKLAIDHLPRLLGRLRKIVIIYNDAKLKQVCVLQWENFLHGDRSYARYNLSKVVEFFAANFELLASYKCLLYLFYGLLRI